MSEFSKMMREALVDDIPLCDERNEDVLAESLGSYRERLRVVRLFGFLMVFAPVLFVLGGAWMWMLGPPETGKILGALLVLFGLTASGMAKMWFHSMVNHLQLLTELKRIQLQLARIEPQDRDVSR